MFVRSVRTEINCRYDKSDLRKPPNASYNVRQAQPVAPITNATKSRSFRAGQRNPNAQSA